MIKSVTIINPFGDDPLVLNLPTSHEEHGIYVKSIDGIGPVKSNINISSLASDDGGVFDSSRIDIRNINLTLGFYESSILHNTIEDSRQLIYKYFPNKKEISLIFKTDNRELITYGYVEDKSPDIFSKEESIQISVLCPDPNFYSLYNTSYVMDKSMGKFEFPFENDTVGETVVMASGILEENQQFLDTVPTFIGSPGKFYYVAKSDPNTFDEYVWTGYDWYRVAENKKIYSAKLIFTSLSDSSVYQVPYDGDNETGVILTVNFLDRVSNLKIYNEDVDGIMIIDTDVVESIIGETIVSGDKVIISTINGSKYAKFQRGANDPINVMNALTQEQVLPNNTVYKYPTWFKLQKGMNSFMFSADSGNDNVKIEIENQIAYEGI